MIRLRVWGFWELSRGTPPLSPRSWILLRRLFLRFEIMMMLELHFDKVLARLGSDFGCQKPCQNGSRLRFGALKASCWANLLQNDMIWCIFWCPPLYVNVRFHCENTGVLNDFHFAFSLLNVILFPLKLYCKSFKMRPKIASESVFFGVQSAYCLLIVSKLNL